MMSLSRICTEGMSSLFPQVMFVFQQYLLHTAASTGVMLHSSIIENVRESCFDLVVVITDLVICDIGGIAGTRHGGFFVARRGV